MAKNKKGKSPWLKTKKKTGPKKKKKKVSDELSMAQNSCRNSIAQKPRYNIIIDISSSLNRERSYQTRLNRSDCQSKIPNARIGLADYQKSYFSNVQVPATSIRKDVKSAEKLF